MEEVRAAVETLRCPTCLSLLLDGGQKRCPACHSKLKTRGKPIVLGEQSRITAQPLLPLERELQARVAAETAAEERRRREVEHARREGVPAASHDEDPASDAEPATTGRSSWARRVQVAREASTESRLPSPPSPHDVLVESRSNPFAATTRTVPA